MIIVVTTKTSERQVVLVLLLLTLLYLTPFPTVSIVDFEQVNDSWGVGTNMSSKNVPLMKKLDFL